MRHVYGWLLLTPAAILLVGFTHYPAIATLADSFFSNPTALRPSRFVGTDNYAALAGDPVFWQVLKNNFWFALGTIRSEEHTSELQSRLHLVCRLLLEKKKKNINQPH